MPKGKSYTAEITQRFLLIRDEAIRDGLCKTASEFAKSVGEYPQNFSLMEKGARSPTLDQIANACEKYGYNANWLLLGKGPKKLEKGIDEPIEKRVTALEVQMRQSKKKIDTATKTN